jgi:hypothetical protein
MNPLFSLLAVIGMPFLGLGQSVAVMETTEFLSRDMPRLKLRRVTFGEAVHQLTKAITTAHQRAPEVKIITYSERQNSDDFPFREEGEFLMSLSLTDITVHEALEVLCFASGFTLHVHHGQICCFQMPHALPASKMTLTTEVPPTVRANLTQVKLLQFKAHELSLEEAMSQLRTSLAETSGKRVLPFVFGEYRVGKAGSSDDHDKTSVSLDLRDVPFEECLRYVAELAGSTYRISADGCVCIQAVHTLYHPKFWRVISTDDFARAMKAESATLTQESIADWLEQKLHARPAFVLHRASGRVYLSRLQPLEVDALRAALNQK